MVGILLLQHLRPPWLDDAPLGPTVGPHAVGGCEPADRRCVGSLTLQPATRMVSVRRFGLRPASSLLTPWTMPACSPCTSIALVVGSCRPPPRSVEEGDEVQPSRA